MIIKPILKLVSALVLMGALGTAHANSIFMTPDSVDAAVGDTVTLDVIMDFSDTTIGGGFDIQYDSSALSFLSWNPNAVGDPGFSGLPAISDGLLSGITVGEFSSGLTGIQNLGSVSFMVLADGGTLSSADTDSDAGPFIDFNTFQNMNVEYNSATVNAVPVPVPAAVWLMVGGLGALFSFRRKRA